MGKIIFIFVFAGMAAGYWVIPDYYISISEPILILGLSVLLFFVGLEMGIEGSAVQMVKKAGIKILIYPLAVILGTLIFAAGASLFLPITAREAMAVSSGFGWYTLAPVILMDYSTEISAISFMHNVMREFIGLLLIPFAAKYIGFIETAALPGAGAMDVFIPIIEKATSKDIVIYSFVIGVILSISVPILVPLFVGL
jgi:uncharacterized membrane protein YbjE (DUF340 family)